MADSPETTKLSEVSAKLSQINQTEGVELGNIKALTQTLVDQGKATLLQQEAVAASEEEARKWRHNYLDVEHFLQVLFSNEKYQDIVNSLTINKLKFLDELEVFLASIEQSNNRQLFIGEDLEILLDTANTFRSRWGSKFIEVSHLLP